MASIDSLYRMNQVDTTAQPENVQDQPAFQPTGIAQEQQNQFVAWAQPDDLPPSPIPDPEVAAVEDRAYRLSLDPANENTLEHLINPETGSSYTDHELSLAIRNGHLRDEIRNGEFGETPYNLVQQTNSHNSYVPSLHPTVTEQYEDFGLHSFELDINTGDPGYFGTEERVDGDWYVHHDSSPIDIPFLHATGSETHTRFLSEGLDEIASLDNVAPITVFLDLKHDAINPEYGHGADDLDALLEAEFGDKLFTPQDWIDSVPGATTLEQAFEMGGWPTMADLEGRVLVVLTGKGNGTENELGEYAGGPQGAGSRAAFIAPEPEVTPVVVRPEWVVPLEDGQVDLGPPITVGGEHIPDSAAVFYNTNSVNEISPIHEGGYATRLWGLGDEADFDAAREAGSGVLGSDYVDPLEFDWSDSSDPVNEIPSFTILERPEPPAPEFDGLVV